jgi:hypothetical protein
MKNGSGVEAGRFGTWGGASSSTEIYKVHTSGLKRVMDLAIAIPVVIFGSPLVLLIYVLLKILDPGPALFMQLRVGGMDARSSSTSSGRCASTRRKGWKSC